MNKYFDFEKYDSTPVIKENTSTTTKLHRYTSVSYTYKSTFSTFISITFELVLLFK
jgi:hypothetical protein